MILRKKKNFKGYQAETCEYICQPNDCGYEPPNCAGFQCECENPTFTCKKTGERGVCECKDNEFLNEYGNCQETEPLPFWVSLVITLFFLFVIFVGFILPIYTFYKIITSDDGKLIYHWYNPYTWSPGYPYWYRPSPTVVIGNTGSSSGPSLTRINNTGTTLRPK